MYLKSGDLIAACYLHTNVPIGATVMLLDSKMKSESVLNIEYFHEGVLHRHDVDLRCYKIIQVSRIEDAVL